MQKIVPHLWFQQDAEEIAQFYASVFSDAQVKWTTLLKDTPGGDTKVVAFRLEGTDFLSISGDDQYQPNPAISLTVQCESEEEVDRLWEALSKDGNVLMPLQEYPFSQRYGWVSDRYGTSWQLLYTNSPSPQKIIPTLLFTKDQKGQAEEAVDFYLSVFSESTLFFMDHYGKNEEPNVEGTVRRAEYQLEGLQFAAMDSGFDHDFAFDLGFSLIIYCQNQEEIDFYWERLSADPESEVCGWLKDRFGVSWQVTTPEMDDMMLTEDEAAKRRVIDAFLPMKKINVKKLQDAFEGKQ